MGTAHGDAKLGFKVCLGNVRENSGENYAKIMPNIGMKIYMQGNEIRLLYPIPIWLRGLFLVYRSVVQRYWQYRLRLMRLYGDTSVCTYRLLSE